MQVFIISHFFFMEISLDIKTCICFLEKKHRRISEISFLPSLRHKLLCTVCNEIPCIWIKKARRICLFSYQKACASKTISKHFATNFKVTDTIVFAATSQLPHFTSTVTKRLRKRSEEAVTLRQKLSCHLLQIFQKNSRQY